VLTTVMYELRVRYKNLLRKYEERENIQSKDQPRGDNKAEQSGVS